jgi:hypothetical protein
MVAIAIFSVDPVFRGSLDQLPREDPASLSWASLIVRRRSSNWPKRITSTLSSRKRYRENY